jgi:hypothetical protein
MYLPKGYDRSKINMDDDSDEDNNEAQSDLVRLALFLPFMSKVDQDSFRFSTAWWEDHYHKDHRGWDTTREKAEIKFQEKKTAEDFHTPDQTMITDNSFT